MLLDPDVLETTNIALGLGIETIYPEHSTPLVMTSQTKCLSSTLPADSTINSSWALTERSGALVIRAGGKVEFVTICMNGLLNKKMRRSWTLMAVREAVPLLDQIVLPVNMKTSPKQTPQDSVSTRTWCVMAILIQAVVGMMKVLIIAWMYTSKIGWSRDKPPLSVPVRSIQVKLVVVSKIFIN